MFVINKQNFQLNPALGKKNRKARAQLAFCPVCVLNLKTKADTIFASKLMMRMRIMRRKTASEAIDVTKQDEPPLTQFVHL